MKTLFIAVLLIAMHSASAQPGNLEAWLTNPCGMPPNDSLDVTGAGVPDLLIGGYSMGTDDVPSSTGSCTRFVGTLHGTTLLCGLDRTGQRVPQAFAVGDTVPALNEGIQNDLQIPRFVFAERSIIVMQWGYGHQVGGPVPAPGLRASATATRQLLYSSDGIDIDLRIQPADASGGPGWRISGQLLGPVGAGQATLQCGNWSASSGWNELCEFSFGPVPGGPCRLLLQGGDWDTEIGPFDLHGPA